MVDSGALVSVAIVVVTVTFILLILLLRAAWNIPPYQQGVLTLYGSYRGLVNPGLNFVNPLARVRVVDLRTRTVPLTPQDQLTQDGVVARVEAALEFKVTDAARAVFQVDDYLRATPALAERALCQAVAQRPLSAVQFDSAQLGAAVRDAIRPTAAGWGVQVDSVDIKRVGTVGSPSPFVGPVAPSGSTLRSGRESRGFARGE